MATMRSIRGFSSGCTASSNAMFVSGPIVTSVTGADALRSKVAMSGTAPSGLRGPLGAGNSSARPASPSGSAGPEPAAELDAPPGVQAARGTVRPTAIAAYQLRFTDCCSFGCPLRSPPL